MSEVINGDNKPKERTGIQERRSYVILALIIVIMFVLFGAGMINYVNNNNKAWCDIIRISFPAKAPVIPADPKADPVGYKRYEGYIALVALDRRFGCN